jgi:hypothetical protein
MEIGRNHRRPKANCQEPMAKSRGRANCSCSGNQSSGKRLQCLVTWDWQRGWTGRQRDVIYNGAGESWDLAERPRQSLGYSPEWGSGSGRSRQPLRELGRASVPAIQRIEQSERRNRRRTRARDRRNRAKTKGRTSGIKARIRSLRGDMDQLWRLGQPGWTTKQLHCRIQRKSGLKRSN